MAVFVLDKQGRPLMPCSEKRARLLLDRGRARVHRILPFVIRLVDRQAEASDFQALRLKIDPGSKATGIALVREARAEQAVLNLFELLHRGRQISEALTARRAMRRRRRGNLRYRAPRFLNRTRPAGWLAPSLQHRVDTTLAWVTRIRRWAPVSALSTELVRFDLQQLENPEIAGVEYQQGTLAGYEVREYLLEKWGRKCCYCDKTDVPLQLEHLVAKARGGSNRVSNLGLAVETASGGKTKFNRSRLGVPKSHALDAACVGEVPALSDWSCPTQTLKCSGRGSYQRTRLDAYGFPRGYLLREKSVKGFQTGDHVVATVPAGKKAGIHVGRVAIRRTGSFNIQTATGVVQGVGWRHCRRVQRGDGYGYGWLAAIKPLTSKEHRLPPPAKAEGYPATKSI